MSLLADLWDGLWNTRHRRLLKRKERERRAIRGHGTWSQQQARITRAQRAKTLAVRGRGSWTAQQNRAARYRRRQIRKQARRFSRKR